MLKKGTNGRPRKNAPGIDPKQLLEVQTSLSVATALKLLRLTENNPDANQIKAAVLYTPAPEMLAACTLAGITTVNCGTYHRHTYSRSITDADRARLFPPCNLLKKSGF